MSGPAVRVTLQEASRRLSVPLGTLYSWSSRGWITPVGIEADGRKLFALDEVAEIVATTRRRKGRHA